MGIHKHEQIDAEKNTELFSNDNFSTHEMYVCMYVIVNILFIVRRWFVLLDFSQTNIDLLLYFNLIFSLTDKRRLLTFYYRSKLSKYIYDLSNLKQFKCIRTLTSCLSLMLIMFIRVYSYYNII